MTPIEVPIIVDARGDVGLFRTVDAAEGYLEPIDVENAEYVAYDSAGRLLELSVEAVQVRRLFGLASGSEERVRVRAAEPHPGHTAELIAALQQALAKVGDGMPVERSSSPEDLVSRYAARAGFLA